MAIGAFAQTSLFSEDFEGGTMPDGWTTDGPGTWEIGTGDYYSTPGAGQGTYNALISHTDYDDVTKLITPEIDLSSVTSATLSFMHIERSWAGDIDELRVYYRASSSDSWTQIAEYTSAYASWTTEEDIVLTNTSSTYQLAFEMTDNYGYGVGIDDIQINLPPLCSKPTALAVSNIDNNNATLTWLAGGTETAWQICLDGDEDNLINVNATTYTFTNLTASTTYNVKVRANCGGSNGDSEWTNNYTFTTAACSAAELCTINYELQDGYGDGWGGYTSNSAINVIDVATTEVLATLTMDNGNSLTGQLSLCNGQEIQFVWVSGDYDDECSYTITDINGDVIFSGSDAMSSPVDYTVSCSSCRRPSDLQVSNITTTSADLVWTPGAEETAWQICINGDEGNIIDVDGNAYGMTGLDELTEYTVKVRAYCSAEEQSAWITTTFTTLSSCPAPEDVEVSDITSYTANISWTAEANADSYIVRYRPLTFVQKDDFENGLDNWTILREDGGTEYTDWRSFDPTSFTSSSLTAHSGSLVAMSRSWSSSAYTVDNWLITPQIPLQGTLNYWVMDDGEYHENYNIYVSTASNAVTDFQLLYTPGNASDEWTEHTVDLSSYNGQMGYIAIRHNDTDQDFLFIDDFGIYTAGEWVEADPTTETSAVISNLAANTTYQYQVASVCGSDDDNWSASGSFTTLVSCPAPTNLTATNVTAHAATLSWTPTGNEEAWQISVGGDEENLISSESNSYDLANLDPETTYTVKVRAYCAADDQSAWTDEVTFTTLPTCVAPTSLTATNVTGHAATITWTAGADETAWQVMINDNDENIVDVEDTPTYEMTELTPETQYSVKVRAYCDVDDQSAWVNVNFTTLIACPAPTALAAHLTPGNGTVATLTWTENGTATAWTLEYGTAADFTGATSMEVTETPSVDLTGLTAETPYYARVKTVCGGVDGESAWSSVINFTPTNAYSITLNDGTETNSYVPVYGLYVDDYSRSQFIIPASDLTALQGATITKLTYYSSTTSTNWGVAEFDVRLAEVENTAIESLAAWDDMTLAYHGSLGISGNVMEVTFDTPYTYMGGNLMIGTNETVSGTYVSCSWYGVTVTGASMGGYESSYTTSFSQRNFLPKVTINYIPGAPRYTITATAGENGTITPSGAVTVTEGDDKEFTITADENYRILSVVVDDADVTAAVVENNGVYTFTNVTADHTIAATFVSSTAVTYTITATAGENGTITPSGAVSVEEGADQPFEITPNANYEIDVLTVDSNEIALMAVYPNPNNGMFSIDFSNIEGEATYQLIDARGAVVETREINVTNGETKMFNHTLTAGTYFVRIINGGKVYVEQIVVE